MLMFKDSKEISLHQTLMVEKADSYYHDYGQAWSIVLLHMMTMCEL